MSSKLEKERQKFIHDKCQRLLEEMLKDDDNKYCVDCDSKGPRWASWNLGIFLCIRCAGIHRNLGVHISRVKSVNLDTWTPLQIACLQQMGNSLARAVYEANLPDNFRRPQSDASLEAFIRAKYEQKKYIASEWVKKNIISRVCPPMPKVNWDKEIEEEAKKKRTKKSVAVASNAQASQPSISVPNLPKPGQSPKIKRSVPPSVDLLELDTPTKEMPPKNGDLDLDLFTSFFTPCQSASNAAEEEKSFFKQASSAQPVSTQPKQLTKDSILALYGNSNTFTPQSGFPYQAENHCTSQTLMNQPSSQLLQDLYHPQTIAPPNANNLSQVDFASNPFYTLLSQEKNVDVLTRNMASASLHPFNGNNISNNNYNVSDFSLLTSNGIFNKNVQSPSGNFNQEKQ